MVAESGRVRLGDFGVAAILDDPTVTTSGAITGSPAYMAPEQATNKGAVRRLRPVVPRRHPLLRRRGPAAVRQGRPAAHADLDRQGPAPPGHGPVRSVRCSTACWSRTPSPACPAPSSAGSWSGWRRRRSRRSPTAAPARPTPWSCPSAVVPPEPEPAPAPAPAAPAGHPPARRRPPRPRRSERRGLGRRHRRRPRRRPAGLHPEQPRLRLTVRHRRRGHGDHCAGVHGGRRQPHRHHGPRLGGALGRQGHLHRPPDRLHHRPPQGLDASAPTAR